MNTRTLLLSILLILLAVVGGFYYVNSITVQQTPIVTPTPTATTTVASSTPPQTSTNDGVITKDANGNSVYTNTTYGISFTVPKGWYVGIFGTSQLFNYDEPTAEATGNFPSNPNKIEISVHSSPIVEDSGSYPKEIYKITKVTVGGVEGTRTETYLVNKLQFIAYIIPLPNHPGSYFGIAIYGDSNNYYILDDLVKTIHFTK